jgi:tetratricopeptide (TPR) repeat protein
VLSWSGDLDEAITQSDMILRDAPDHKEALLVRADALQWQGRFLEAIPIYRNVIARDNDFDARVGLSRSLLALGDRVGAVENLHSLKPANTPQKRELARLTDAVERETRSSIEGRYNYYIDSDHNRLHRYALAGSLWIDNQKYGLDYRHTDAKDRTRDNRAEDFLLKVYSRLTDRFSGGVGLGFTQLDDRHTSNFPAGQFASMPDCSPAAPA